MKIKNFENYTLEMLRAKVAVTNILTSRRVYVAVMILYLSVEA